MQNNYIKRRDKLVNNIGDGSLLILFSSDIYQNPESCFRVNRNFYYLTGIDASDMALVLENRRGYTQEHIFIKPYDELEAKWVGGRLKKDEVENISGIKDVRELHELDDFIFNILERDRGNDNFKIYLDFWIKEGSTTLSSNYADILRNKKPSLNLLDAFPLIAQMRLIKDEQEIECIKKANAITKDGVELMMKSIRPNLYEMQMEATFNYAISKHNVNELAFKTIAASGIRATTLHYSDNNQIMKDGELFLQDLGACYKHYCSDITRTYPVNGKFSDRQKEIYNIVLNAQKLVERSAKAGMSLYDLNQLVISYYKKELPKHGLNKDVSEYYYHSVSHHLGLDCHDADGGLGMKLKEGNVISNEPGIYIEEEGIGIRIEDDLLITKKGAINLSKDIIKEIDDIEAFMSH